MVMGGCIEVQDGINGDGKNKIKSWSRQEIDSFNCIVSFPNSQMPVPEKDFPGPQ